ncbi:TetR/AcrR family transcriptional regulator [Sphingomonas sp. HT-1]|uniref:TetR/AcrR family transcriptional regulator n=1 Tax=unclassified Sphingomonas TaxID=196159 RepID=UPI0002F44BF9|nr:MULTISPECIES: TetR/AcrR family transcriptional regulator [unclassified Sphingomonas]KTF70644.1 TetR family transcriptional regulator [Sphingomonas sp. WG]
MESVSVKHLGKRESRKQDRRAAILVIAKRHFMEQGYAAVSMSAIAAELGGSKGTLWSYFASKEELFDACVDEATREYREQVLKLLVPSDDLRATLCAFTLSLLRKITSRDAIQLHRVIHAEVERSPEMGAIFFRRGPQRTREMLAAHLQDAMQKGQLRQSDPLRAAFALTSLCMGAQQRAMLGHQFSQAELEEETDYNVDLFLRAFAPEPAAP